MVNGQMILSHVMSHHGKDGHPYHRCDVKKLEVTPYEHVLVID